jgi:hypothetical protein
MARTSEARSSGEMFWLPETTNLEERENKKENKKEH